MINFKDNLANSKAKSYKLNRGMTYVEIIVVLGIFAVMSSIIIFNYGEFQARVDIKNLASDIALKIVEAQKSSLSGNLPSSGSFCSTCNPSYGVYFDVSRPLTQFIYFADLDNSKTYYNESPLDTLITKNNYSISGIDKCSGSATCNLNSNPVTTSLSITFKRPDSRAFFYSNSSSLTGSFDYIQISIKSPRSATAKIKIYPSGRIQVN